MCQIADLINALIIWSINRHASLCFVFYVSAFTAAVTVAGLYFMAIHPPKFFHLHPVSLSHSLTLSLLLWHNSILMKSERPCCLKLSGKW